MRNPGGALHLFHEEQIKTMTIEWQRSQDPELLNEILVRTQPLITGVLLTRSKHTEDFEELLNLLRERIWKKLPHFNPAKGRIFSYLTMVAHQLLDEVWARRRLYQSRYNPTGLESLGQQYSTAAPNHFFDDIIWRIHTVQTTFDDPFELKAQRWLVWGLLDSCFTLRRHEAADSTVIVYGLHPSRARKLHDATVLEVRRTLLDVVEIPKITVADLRGTRQSALAKYADQLAPEDFSKLIYLMRNLAPVIIDDLNHVLNGHPEARPLFASNYAL